MPRLSPIVELFWGGVHAMLILEMAASVSPSGEEQIPHFARGAARHQLERLRKVYNGADAQLSSPFLSDSKTTEGRFRFSVKPASVFRISLHDEGAWQVFNEKWNDSEEERPRRKLQGTCIGEFSITSNVTPVLEGCFQEIESQTTSTINGQETYGMVPDSQGGATFVYAFFFDTVDPPLRWVIEYYASDTATVGTSYCYSDESADEVHPADATWICDLSGAATDFTEVTALEMGVACGCSGITPSPSTLIEPVDTVAPFTPSPVIITSAPFSVVESPMPSSTVTGTVTPPTPSPAIITSAPFSVVESPMPFSTVTGTLAPFTPSPVIITSAPFSVVGSPLPSSTVTVTCDGEFSITSNVAPVLEGCFQNTDSETTSTTNGEEIYEMVPESQEGGTTFLFALVIDAFNPPLRWVMFYFVSGTSTAGAWYCYSDETADEVHPADATWICDLSGEASTFTVVTAPGLAVACGCSGIAPSESSSSESEEQEETDSTLTFFAFSKFVTVLVVFTATIVLLV